MSGYMRLRVEEDDLGVPNVRLARDDKNGRPEHLEHVDGGRVDWRSHEQGDVIPSISIAAFIAWIYQAGPK